MKLRDLYRINSRRGLFLSVLIHFLLLAGVMTATIKFTTPDGMVMDASIDMQGASVGIPTPVEVKENTLPKGKIEAQNVKNLPVKEAVVEAPEKPSDSNEIEKQDVDVPVKNKEQTRAKLWKPVEETDVDDNVGAGKIAKSSDDQESEAGSTESEEESAGVPDGESSTGNEGTSIGENYSGPVHSEAELRGQAGDDYPYPYPYFARVQRVEGTVTIRFTLRQTGEVEKVWLQESSGSSLLDKSVLEAHAKRKYEKYLDGVIQKKVRFVLKGNAEQEPYRK